jgi:hypothetical protein
MSSAYPQIIQETAHAALANINGEIAKFLRAVEPELAAALRIGSYRPDVAGELAYLQETITEHLRAQLFEAFDAASDFADANPMRPAPTPLLTVACEIVRGVAA